MLWLAFIAKRTILSVFDAVIQRTIKSWGSFSTTPRFMEDTTAQLSRSAGAECQSPHAPPLKNTKTTLRVPC